VNTAATPVENSRNGGKRPSLNDAEKFSSSSTATVPLFSLETNNA